MKTISKNNPLRPYRKAFSLVELLVVITIIAILSVVAYTAVGGQTSKAKDAKRKSDLDTIQNALEVYYIEEGYYPAVDGNGTVTVGGAGLTKKQLSKLPVDPESDDLTTIYYKYAVNQVNQPQSFQLAATLHNEGIYKAYLVGNAENDLITGISAPNENCGAAKVTDGSVACVPYQIW